MPQTIHQLRADNSLDLGVGVAVVVVDDDGTPLRSIKKVFKRELRDEKEGDLGTSPTVPRLMKRFGEVVVVVWDAVE